MGKNSDVNLYFVRICRSDILLVLLKDAITSNEYEAERSAVTYFVLLASTDCIQS